MEFRQSVDVGLVVVVVVVEEVELVGGRAEEMREEEVVTGASGETGVVMASLEIGGGDVALETDETKATERASVTELVVVERPGGISDMLVEGGEAVVVTEIAASPPAAAGAASTEPFGSGKVNLVDRFVDAVETELSLLGAETVSEVVMEGVVIVVELEVTERLGVMDSEEEEVAETVVGGSVGVAVLVRVVGKVAVGS